MDHTRYTIGRLETESWDAFVHRVERDIGIRGGYWSPRHVEYQRGASDP